MIEIGIGIAALWLAYKMGEANGVAEANRSALGVGVWVKVVKPLSYHKQVGASERIALPIGAQGIIAGMRQGGIHGHGVSSLWIAAPYVQEEMRHKVYLLTGDYTAFRAIPDSSVSDEYREETREAWLAHEAEGRQVRGDLGLWW